MRRTMKAWAFINKYTGRILRPGEMSPFCIYTAKSRNANDEDFEWLPVTITYQLPKPKWGKRR